MNKVELAEVLVNKELVGTKKIAVEVVETLFDTITEEVKKGEKVSIHGFGSFEQVVRSARKGHNPKTGDEITIPEKKAPKFTASKVLKESVNQ